MSFSLLDLFLAMGIGQGLVLVLAIARFGSGNKGANKLLQVIIVMSMLMLVGRILAFGKLSELSLRLGTFVDITIFLFGPVSLLFAKSYTDRKAKISILHWVPASIHFVFFIWTCFLSYESYAQYLRAGFFIWAFFIMETLGLISMIVYTLASLRLVRITFQRVGFVQSPQKPFLYALFGSLLAIEVFWVFGYLESNFFQVGFNILAYQNIWTFIPIFFSAITIFGLFNPKVLKRIGSIPTISERVRDEKKVAIMKNLLKVMEEGVYLNADLSLPGLAAEIGVSANDLSWFLNAEYGRGFYEFINERRLKAFEEKIRNREHKERTLLALAYEVGFNSKTTFNKVFKEMRKETPSSLVKKIEKEREKMVA